MAEYKTHQKELLLRYLYAHRARPMRVEEIAEALRKDAPDAPGKSTVYRLIGRLYEEGSVKRFEDAASRAFTYQYAGGEACRSHLHMKCLDCGRLLHMDREQSRRLTGEIFGENGFEVDQEETTLFGHCAECRAGKKEESQ